MMSDQFQQLLEPYFPNCTVVSYCALTGGLSASMTSVKIRLPDGKIKIIIVRQPAHSTTIGNLENTKREFQLLSFLVSQNIKVPAPLFIDETNTINNRTSLILNYIKGSSRFPKRGAKKFYQESAWYLVKIHTLPIKDLGFLPSQTDWINDVLENEPAVINSIMLEANIRDQLRKYRPISPPEKPALLHGDYWPGNWLWSQDSLAAIIDWEDAEIGHPLYDLAVSRLDLCWICSPETMRQFTAAYQSRQPFNETQLAWWDLFAALRLIRLAGQSLTNWVSFFHPYGRKDITETTMLKNYRLFVQDALSRLGNKKIYPL